MRLLEEILELAKENKNLMVEIQELKEKQSEEEFLIAENNSKEEKIKLLNKQIATIKESQPDYEKVKAKVLAEMVDLSQPLKAVSVKKAFEQMLIETNLVEDDHLYSAITKHTNDWRVPNSIYDESQLGQIRSVNIKNVPIWETYKDVLSLEKPKAVKPKYTTKQARARYERLKGDKNE